MTDTFILCRYFGLNSRKTRLQGASYLRVVTTSNPKSDAEDGRKIGKEDSLITHKMREENKSERRMPRLLEAKKDVILCDKPRGTANKY